MINLVNSLPPFIWITIVIAVYFLAFIIRSYWIIILSLVIIIIASSLLFLPSGRDLIDQASTQPSIIERANCVGGGVVRLAPWREKKICIDQERREISLPQLNRSLRCSTNQPCWPTRWPNSQDPGQ